MSRFGLFRNKEDKNAAENDGYEYYEDTHTATGEYTGRLRDFQRGDAKPQPTGARAYQNFMVYEPKNADDVQTLIDFLKTRESAIMNLENVDEAISQRVLDFVSGAIYALNGSVNRISGNIFLLSPEGSVVTNSYETERK